MHCDSGPWGVQPFKICTIPTICPSPIFVVERHVIYSNCRSQLHLATTVHCTRQLSIVPGSCPLYQAAVRCTRQLSIVPDSCPLYQAAVHFTRELSIVPGSCLLYQAAVRCTRQLSIVPDNISLYRATLLSDIWRQFFISIIVTTVCLVPGMYPHPRSQVLPRTQDGRPFSVPGITLERMVKNLWRYIESLSRLRVALHVMIFSASYSMMRPYANFSIFSRVTYIIVSLQARAP